MLLKIVKGQLRIQYVKPAGRDVLKDDPGPFPSNNEREFRWPSDEWEETLGACEVEPGENNQFHYDVRLKQAVEVVKVYSYYKNEVKKGRDIGWNLTTLYDLNAAQQQREKSLIQEVNP